jgi:cytochrome c oxidase subunit 1
MDVFRMPLTVWGFTFTAILNVLFLPVLSAAMLLLFMDRTFGTTIFAAAVPGSTTHGDPVLYQHLFWIFGHPEVYLVILPAWGILGDLLAVFSRKPAFGYRMTVLSMALITLLSGLVYGHHMFTVGLGPLFSEAFMLLTLMISIPSSILYLNWLGTLWRGSIRLDPPMLFCLGMMVVFALGGLTGMHLGAAGTNLYLHDSYFVVGHFHLTMAVSVLLGTFAGIYYWFPKMTGRMLGKGLSSAHFWLTFVPSILVFGGMLVLGYAGMQRRLYNPSEFDFLKPLAPLNEGVSWMAFILGFGQLLFLWNVVVSWKRGLPAPANPWGAGTLEWMTSSPPSTENFPEIPVVRCGPHVFKEPDSSGRDFRSQVEET